MQESSFGKLIGFGLLVLMVLVLLFSSFVTIHAGERGVKTRLGAVVAELDPGLHFKKPFVEHVVLFDVQTQKEQATASAASSDLQTVSTQIAINYNIVPGKLSDLYTRIGADYKNKVIDPAIQEAVKSVTAHYTAEELITKRPEVTTETQKALADKLASNDIEVSSVNIVDFDFSPQFNAAIEAKVTAEQNALAAKNKLDQVTYEGQQTVVAAKAQAEAIQIQAQAIQQQGGANYVELKRIEKWNGQGCTSYCGLSTSNGLLLTGK